MTGAGAGAPTRGDAIVLRHRLAARGIAVGLWGGELYAEPADRLTERDRDALRGHAHALRYLLAEPGLDPVQEAIAGRRRTLIDDAGYPVCPACGGRTKADGVRTCPACAVRPRALAADRGRGASHAASIRPVRSHRPRAQRSGRPGRPLRRRPGLSR